MILNSYINYRARAGMLIHNKIYVMNFTIYVMNFTIT